ncbi:hypothetical protein BV25DRAFT_1831961 [Artomyces pyxidatus]|uniref:Uncharacterized protein n=1 Tax=Artomyces pyxidatus TaxID=48021 RepID=A0ACB8SKF7_9AGAM|nr:hypothetical protein BV25DRAFT_1831961 [Artomyces pyxidatus]
MTSSIMTRMNTLIPIASLPSDVMERVFLQLTILEPPSSKASRGLGWIKVSHVCREWRAIALGYASLWHTVVGGDVNARWAGEILARSKAAPVAIAIRNPSDPWLAHISGHLYHTRHLDVSVSDSVPKALVSGEYLASPAPLLETFAFDTRFDGVQLPNLLFANYAPRLRRVTLLGCVRDVPWSSPVFRGLVHLHLQQSGSETPSPENFGALFDSMRSIPALETLALIKCLPDTPALSESDDGVLELPALTKLHLHSSVTACASFLRNLRIPPSTILDLQCEMHSNTEHDILLPVLAAHLTAVEPGLEPITTAVVESRHGSNVAFSAWRSCTLRDGVPALSPAEQPALRVRLEQHGPAASSTPPHLSSAFLTELPLRGVRALRVASMHAGWTADHWVDVARNLEGAEHVSAEDRASDALLHALDKGGAVFPRLRALGLSLNMPPAFLQELVRVKEAALEALFRALEERRRVGTPGVQVFLDGRLSDGVAR